MNLDDLPGGEDEINEAHRVALLIAGYINNKLTQEEASELDAWVKASEHNDKIFRELTDEKNIEAAMDWYRKLDAAKALARVKRRISAAASNRSFKLKPWLMAAAILVLAAAGLDLMVSLYVRSDTSPVSNLKRSPSSRPSDPDMAILELADGHQIFIGKTGALDTIIGENRKILIRNNEIIYQAPDGQEENEGQGWNRLSIPGGRTCLLSLPDGTQAWLNAASTLRFPSAFARKERKVELTGEGYFEVAKDQLRPFHIRVQGTEIEVLGTHFNINAYAPDEAIRTTLLEGSVRISRSGSVRILKPGEEARSNAGGIRVVAADTSAVMGWRQGNFVFRSTAMHEVLKEMERWYQVEIEDQSGDREHLNGTFSRSMPLSRLMHFIELSMPVKFEKHGNKWLVSRQKK